MLGGLLIWAAHFLGLYILASLADVAGDGVSWKIAGLAFSAICMAGAVFVGFRADAVLNRSPRDTSRAFGLRVGVLGAAMGGLGVAFQTLVLVIDIA